MIFKTVEQIKFTRNYKNANSSKLIFSYIFLQGGVFEGNIVPEFHISMMINHILMTNGRLSVVKIPTYQNF